MKNPLGKPSGFPFFMVHRTFPGNAALIFRKK